MITCSNIKEFKELNIGICRYCDNLSKTENKKEINVKCSIDFKFPDGEWKIVQCRSYNENHKRRLESSPIDPGDKGAEIGE